MTCKKNNRQTGKLRDGHISMCVPISWVKVVLPHFLPAGMELTLRVGCGPGAWQINSRCQS